VNKLVHGGVSTERVKRFLNLFGIALAELLLDGHVDGGGCHPGPLTGNAVKFDTNAHPPIVR